jgi:hypothetical protein
MPRKYVPATTVTAAEVLANSPASPQAAATTSTANAARARPGESGVTSSTRRSPHGGTSAERGSALYATALGRTWNA